MRHLTIVKTPGLPISRVATLEFRMKLATKFALAAALIFVSPLANGSAVAAPKGEPSGKFKRAQKLAGQHERERASRYRRSAPAPRAARNHPWPDPSFDRSGRPYRPNFYSPCTVDLGYGRFADCNSWND